MAAVLFRGRSLKSRRLRGRHESTEESVTLDYSKDASENVRDILSKIVWRENITKAKHLGLFNAFVRFCYRYSNAVQSKYNAIEVLCCLRLGLLHEAKEIRAAALRAIRYFVQDGASFDALLTLHIDYLIVRCLDICTDNEVERIQALRLIRHLIHLDAMRLPPSLIFTMVSISNDGAAERDKMLRTCLAIICELALRNAALVSSCGGLSAMLKNVLQPQHLGRIHEALLLTVVSLLNRPVTRQYINPHTDLEQVLAPFTDCHNKPAPDSANLSTRQDKDNRFIASKFAIATIMKSWPGLVRLCRPDGSGLQSLLGVLYLKNMETRKEILDIFFDVFHFTTPRWCDTFSEALLSIDPTAMRDEWRLQEGFVAEEGKTILPNLAQTRPNLLDNHHALLLSAFFNAGLLEALVETITTSDIHVSVRATILLGELLHMANRVLPNECSQHSYCLPSLIALASSFDVPAAERDRASQSVSCLSRLHALRKRANIPSSLFLGQLLQTCAHHSSTNDYEPTGFVNSELLVSSLPQPIWALQDQSEWSKPSNMCIPLLCIPPTSGYLTAEASYPYITNESYTAANVAIRDSRVTNTKDNMNWDWELVIAILKWPDENLMKFDDQENQRFVRRLVHYFKPSNRLYSVIDLAKDVQSKCTLAGLGLLDFLLSNTHAEAKKYMEEFLADVSKCLEPICTQKASADALFTPDYLLSTCSQYYFLFIGRMSSTTEGEKLLNSGVYQQLLNLMTITNHDIYIKLVVSCLDYTRDGFARVLLSKGLSSTSEAGRLYATSFMRVLLRARVPLFNTWALEMLTQQLFDQSKAVAMQALSVLSEACEHQDHLDKLITLSPSVLHLGHKGAVLLARFVSITKGFRQLSKSNYIHHELEMWYSTTNMKYVQIVEERLSEALTSYEKTFNGSFVRRRSSKRQGRTDVFLPLHLYGQLVQCKHGFLLLKKQEYLCEFFNAIRHQQLQTDESILKVKAALWALGHIGTSVRGVHLLIEQKIIAEIIKLAEQSEVFSVRGTAYYVLGLLASTTKGVRELRQYGWECVRHRHGDAWPVSNDDDDDDTIDEDGSPLASSASSASLNDSTRSEIVARTPVIKATTLSPAPSIGSSPRVSFFIEPTDATTSKSRSNTGSSGAVVFCSRHSSPCQTFGGGGDGVGGGGGDSGVVEPCLRGDDEQLPPCDGAGDTAQTKRTDDTMSKLAATSTSEQPESDKPRSESLTTDTTTSGFSSYESGQQTAALMSSAVVSTSHRRLANLRPMSLLRRRSSSSRQPVATAVTPRDAAEEFAYTSTRDSLGYATLRALRRDRASSFESPEHNVEVSTPACYGDSHIAKTRSLDFRLGRPNNYWKPDFGTAPYLSTPIEDGASGISKVNSSANLVRRKCAAGRPEFTGIAMPIDVNVMFHVHSDDKADSVTEDDNVAVTESTSSLLHTVTDPAVDQDEIVGDGLEYHSATTCLGCQRLYDGRIQRQSGDGSLVQEDSSISSTRDRRHSHKGSFSETQPGSLTSSTSLESFAVKDQLNEGSKEGRARIRFEIIKLVVKLGSSVGVKGTEQGLLILKQKFPKAFQDICLYSEICYLLSHYSYRLISRRFIQEIFQEVDFEQLYEDAQNILGLKEENKQAEITLKKVCEVPVS